MSEAKIRAIIKRPDEKFGHVTNISNNLGNLQRNVGGFIETVTVSFCSGKLCTDLVIICDEEGRLKGKPYNCTIAGVDFVGDIVVLGVDGEEFTDCPLAFSDWKERFLGIHEGGD